MTWQFKARATAMAFAAVTIAAALMAACSQPSPEGSSRPAPDSTDESPISPAPIQQVLDESGKFQIEPYARDLDFPVDMAWVPRTKKIFYTEKNTGRVRVMIGQRVLGEPCVDLDVAPEGLQGATGLILHPDFEENHWLYVYYTHASPDENQLTRFTVEGNRCTSPRIILDGLTASNVHNGGQLEFAGDKLFVTTGDANDRRTAQQVESRLGKVLRLNDDGSIPAGNPFSRAGRPNPVWSYGHRNAFGLAYAHGKDRLYATENGPECDDELNVIIRGANYGWGQGYECGSRGVGSNPRGPLIRWSQIIVPTDLSWYDGPLKSLAGALYMGDVANEYLYRFDFNSEGTEVIRRSIVARSDEDILSVAEGPGGGLYLVTKTGSASQAGSILRVVPRKG